jgi:hypothetical protein
MSYDDMSAKEIKKSLGFSMNEIVGHEMLAGKLGVDICETTLTQECDHSKVLCAIVNKERPTIFYHKILIDGQGTERVAITYALVHGILRGMDNLMITCHTIMSEQEEMLIYEMLMPQDLVTEELKKGASINALSHKFNVPKKCVRERLDAMPAMLMSTSNR